MNVRAIYIHALVILAVVMAGVSPACAFISGKGMIEICAPDGTLQTIEVDEAFDPFAEKMPLSEHLEAMEQCSYCFSADKHKAVNVFTSATLPRVFTSYLAVSSGTAIPLGARYHLYNPRGPPQIS